MIKRLIIPAMVGRAAQLTELAAHLAAVQGGESRVVFIHGEAGIGKTRLVREFAALAGATPGVVLLEGHCYDEDTAAPFGPFIDLLRMLIQARGATTVAHAAGALAGDLARLLPELNESLPAAAEHEPQIEKRRLFEAIARALRPADPAGCHILVLEDLHWSDQTSQELIAYLARGAASERLLLIGTYRSEELHRRHPLLHTIAQLSRERRYYELALAALNPAEFIDLLEAALERGLPRGFVDLLYTRTEGNPLFVEEVLESLVDRAQLEPLLQSARYGRAPERIEIPISIKDSILRRTADLDATTAGVLSYAAVVGRRFDFELLLRLTQLPEPALLRALVLLVERQLVVEEASESDDRYSFRHELIREAVYDDLLRRERRMKHREVLHALEEVYANRFEQVIDQLAYHGLQAREPQAAAYARMAGERAEQMYAYREAAAHYEAALEAAEQAGATPRQRAELLVRLGHAIYPLGDLQRCVRCWHEARTIYEQLGEPILTADMWRWLGRAAWELGDGAAALAHTHAALVLLEAAPPGRELAMAYSALSQIHMLSNQSDEAIRVGNKALQLAETLGDQQVIAHALNNIGSAQAAQGNYDEGIANLERSLRLAREAGLASDTIRAYINLGGQLPAAGQLLRSAELLREGANYAEQVGWDNRLALLLPKLVHLELILGRWQAAQQVIERLERLVERGLPVETVYLQSLRCRLLIYRGQLGEARQLLERQPVGIDNHELALKLGWSQMLFYLATGELQRAADATDTVAALRGASANEACSIDDLYFDARIYLLAGRTAAAERVVATIEQMAATRQLGIVEQACLAEVRGLVALRAGQPAADCFAAAVAIWQQLSVHYYELVARRGLAEALLQGGRRDQARIELATARELAEQIGAQGEVEALEALARQHGLLRRAPRPATADAPPDALTPRERQVLARLARGASNRIIAEALVISEKTVEVHVSNILAKLGFSSRAQAAVYAVEQGIAEAA